MHEHTAPSRHAIREFLRFGSFLQTSYNEVILKLLPHTRQNGCFDILHCCNDPCLYVSEVTLQWWDVLVSSNVVPTLPRELAGTDRCSSEEFLGTHVDACVAIT
jgi:hypothetical protein